MQIDWYRLFNLPDFESADIPSYTATVDLSGIGVREVLITKGNGVSITYDGTMLMVGLNDKNPFRNGDKSVFLDSNNDVWLGVYRAD